MSAAHAAKADKVDASMKMLVKDYIDNPNAQLIELMLQGWQCLEKEGLGEFMTVHSTRTLTHPRNRGSGMLEIAYVPEQVADISDCSFSLHEVGQAAAVRMPMHGTSEREEIEEANEELVVASCGTLAPVVKDACDVMVVSCSHNSAGLKGICAKAKCTIDRISENGKYSANKITGRCPTYAAPIKDGLKYFVMEYIVEKRWPEFVDLTIEACNIGSAIAKPDTPVQLMLKAHSMAAAKIKAKAPLDYGEIRMRMERTKPMHKELLPEIVKFVEDWSGGVQNPRFLWSLLDFVRTLDAPKYANLTVDVLKKINSLKLGEGKGARYRMMLIKALLLHDGLVNNGTLNMLKPSANAFILAMKAEEEVTTCEAAMMKLVKTKGDDKGIVFNVIGRMEADIVGYVHSVIKKHSSIAAVLAEHMDILCIQLKVKNKSNYQTAEPTMAKGSAQTPNRQMQELGALGCSDVDLRARALQRGLDLGAHVQACAKPSAHAKALAYEIVEMPTEDDCKDGTAEVKMTVKGDKRRKVAVSLQKLLDGYSLVVSPDVVPFAIERATLESVQKSCSFQTC